LKPANPIVDGAPLDFELVAEGLAFPEGPVVMADGSVILVELVGGRISRCWNGRREVISEIGGGPNGAAIGPDGALYVCNSGGVDLARQQNATGPGTEGRIERVDLATGRVERLYESCDGHPLSAPNDLVFAPNGELWFTDLGKIHGFISEAGGLFRCQTNGAAIAAVRRGPVSYNGVGISPDGATVYVADTHQARVYAFAADEAKPEPRFIATVPGPVGLDSLAITAAGNICVARIYQGGMATVTPDGTVSTIPLDDYFVTNIAFGGNDMRDAYITLSASGRLIKARWPEPGLKLAFNN
jgi:gluconolactonase